MVDRSFPTDDRGVSPVIGVILMVALTVILATVLGTVVLDFASGVSEQPPQAAFDYEFEDDEEVTITHVSGDSIDNSTISVLIDGKDAFPADDANDFTVEDWHGTIQAGDSVTIEDDDGVVDDETTVRIIWENPSSSSANTIDSREWP